MTVRAFDNWVSYLDNAGHLLHGKIRFCKKGTTDNVVIYNSDGDVALRNPEFTDMLGRTEYQVFVDSETDVTAYFWKYVGNGDMMGTDPDDYDPSRWEYQYSSDNLDPAKAIVLEADTAHGVATMSDLRATDPDNVPVVNGAKLLWLYGYYNAGDTSPVLYVWDGASSVNDDGGAVVQPTSIPGNGRWILASRELHFDVRHFGIFPTDDIYSTDYSYTSQLSNCADYLNREGLDAWFPAINDNLTYYLFDGSNTFAIGADIYISDAVRMHCKSGTSGTVIQCHEIHKAAPSLFVSSSQTGTATITADWINISWVGGQVAGNARVGWVIDTADYARTITGKRVVFKANGNYSLQLDNCVVESNHVISDHITMSNMAIHTDWFLPDYNWSNLSLYNCTVALEDCSSADLYVQLKNKMGQSDYGSLAEATVANATFLDGAIIEDAVLSACTFGGSAELRNVSGDVTFQAASSINAVDCWITNNASAVLDSLIINRGSIAGSAVQVLSVLRLVNVAITAPISVTGGNLFLTDCEIYAAMAHVMNNDVKEEIKGCTFNAQLTVSGGAADTAVHAAWVGNYGTVADPVTFDRTNLKAVDAEHSYVYRDNSGTFDVTTYETFTIHPTGYGYVPGTPGTLNVPSGRDTGGVYGWTETDDPSKYICRVRLFTVGTVGVRKRFEALPQSPVNKYSGSDLHLTGGIVYGSTMDHVNETNLVSTLLFDSGFTWKVRNLSFAGYAYPVDGMQFTAYFREVQ